MKILYTDASFDWNSTEKITENVVRGKIAVSDGSSFERIEKLAIGKVEGLKQYINIFELTAIARAVELAATMKEKDGTLEVWTDSQTAMIWAARGDIKPKIKTVAHQNALGYLRGARIVHGGLITFHYIPRENNPAGHLLAAELEKEAPHSIGLK